MAEGCVLYRAPSGVGFCGKQASAIAQSVTDWAIADA